jgi:hypothetical protein
VIGDRIEPPATDVRDALDRWDGEGDPSDPLAYSPDEDDESDDNEDTPEDMDEQIVDERPVLTLDHWSILLLFKRFREYALNAGVEAGVNRYAEDDIHGWACSLFYKVKPVMFRARVREGRIGRVSAEDLLSTETLRRLEEERRVSEEELVRIEMERESEASFEDVDLDAVSPQANDEEERRVVVERAETPAEAAAAVADRIMLHDQAAGERCQSMTTRPLRRYATSVGVGGAWEMSKEEIMHELANNQAAADMAQRVVNTARSQTGAVR